MTPTTSGSKPPDLRLPALRRFAIAITVVNLLGHTILGFEPSWAQMFTALFTAYGLDLLLEWIQARMEERLPRFRGSFVDLVNFLLPAHITGLAIGMLLYANDRLLPFAFAAAAAIASKAILTAPVGKGHRHFMNPSNFGLAAAFLCLPDIAAIAVPYQFTADLSGFGDWLLPLVVICSGSFLNTFFTRRGPTLPHRLRPCSFSRPHDRNGFPSLYLLHGPRPWYHAFRPPPPGSLRRQRGRPLRSLALHPRHLRALLRPLPRLRRARHLPPSRPLPRRPANRRLHTPRPGVTRCPITRSQRRAGRRVMRATR